MAADTVTATAPQIARRSCPNVYETKDDVKSFTRRNVGISYFRISSLNSSLIVCFLLPRLIWVLGFVEIVEKFIDIIYPRTSPEKVVGASSSRG